MTQSSLWQDNKQNNDFAEICNALYERELRLLANIEVTSVQSVQGRLKSLPYYINRTASMMIRVNELGNSPLTLDVQNASWSAKQASHLPLAGEDNHVIHAWYTELLNKADKSLLGLVVPVLAEDHIIIDCIDGVDAEKNRLRTNVSGWLSLTSAEEKATDAKPARRLLKPNKKVMLAACAGHRWQSCQSKKLRPIIPSLRELLLSCSINWQNFHQVLK
ncbi:MAG: hypothetical protein OQK09_08690 [Colwellia sp.]|nr:hypothetical protein [Colwellia sp.]MCW9081576.1 hypothetical protein [Colwellia sp.]